MDDFEQKGMCSGAVGWGGGMQLASQKSSWPKDYDELQQREQHCNDWGQLLATAESWCDGAFDKCIKLPSHKGCVYSTMVYKRSLC